MTDQKENSIRIYEVVISVTALVLFGVLFTVTQLFQSPFVVFGVILFVLIPFRKSKLVKIIISLSSIIFALWFIHSISNLLAPFVIALIIAYTLNPVVEFLSQKKISRTLASALILVIFLLIAATAIILLAPPIAFQFSELIKSLPQAVKDLQSWVDSILIPKLAALGIPTADIQNKVSQEMPAKLEGMINGLLSGLSGIFAGLSVILTQIVNLILIPFLSFYIMKDFDNLKSLVKELFPISIRKKVVEQYRKIDGMLGSFIRGQLTVSLIHGIIVYAFLSILGVKYAVFLGAIGVILNIIPYVGLLVEITLAVIVSLFSGDPGLQVPSVIIIYLLLNLLETSVIIPKIVGDRIGLHPAILILSLFVFSYFFGFVGMLIALPAMSIIIMFFKEWLSARAAKEAK
ncbi:MAG: AI-2E family transporter [Ignavibacteria bacterium]|nr:AI-2E family transporter [Ignavibacteria bacterium]MCC7159286.1 AI-2E family transporter [Ignavibacteria bacterium]